MSCHVTPVAGDLVAEYRRHGRIDGPVAVLLPEAIEDVEAVRSKGAAGAPKPSKIVRCATSIDLLLLAEVPAQFAGVIEPERNGHLFSRGGFKQRYEVGQVARYQQSKLPLRQSSEEFAVTVQEGAKVDRRRSVDYIEEHVRSTVGADADGHFVRKVPNRLLRTIAERDVREFGRPQ